MAFDLDDLLAGGAGLSRERNWVALAPHLDAVVTVGSDERELLGRVSPSEWTDAKTFAGSETALKRLLENGLLIGGGKRHASHRARDEQLRETHWHPLAATFHGRTQPWHGVGVIATAARRADRLRPVARQARDLPQLR